MILANLPHYEAHLRPLAELLPDLPDVALVASYQDMRRARRAGMRIVLSQHGIGQSYSDDNPHYPGGRDNEGVGLFLVPNHHAANRWRNAYPAARVEVVGSPRLDDLPRREPGSLTVCISFHWNAFHTPEARSAYGPFSLILGELARSVNLIGHSHPRRDMTSVYERLGVEYVRTFDEVCRRADLYIADNTSTLFEFAATGRPVVVLNAPYYRRDAQHGLRFWDAADVGVQVDDPADLLAATERAMSERVDDIGRREIALDLVYAHRTGAAQRAADAVTDWLS